MSKLQLWAQYKNQPAEHQTGKDDWTLVAEFDEIDVEKLFLKKIELLDGNLVDDVFTTKQVNIEVSLL